MSGIPYGGGRSYGDRFRDEEDGAGVLVPPSAIPPVDVPESVRRLMQQFDLWPTWTQVGSTSPLTGSSQVMTRQHAWRALMTWPIITHDQAHPIDAFFHRLTGKSIRVKIGHLKYRQTLGTKTGSVSLSGDHPVGAHLLSITGGSGLFVAGDYFQITQGVGIPRLYQVVQGEDELGAGSIAVNPGLRVAHGDGANIDHLGEVNPLHETMELSAELPARPMFPGPEPGWVRPAALELVSMARRD